MIYYKNVTPISKDIFITIKTTLLEPNSFFWSADCGSQEVQPEHCNFGTKDTQDHLTVPTRQKFYVLHCVCEPHVVEIEHILQKIALLSGQSC